MLRQLRKMTVKTRYRIRELKAEIKKMLLQENLPATKDLMQRFPAEQLVSPLISFFCNADKVLKWRAVSAFTLLLNLMATEKMETARIIIRRLMWTLNEESGGVGWGAPEAMGEVMRLNSALAAEYHNILFSYIDDHGNFLDYEPLQQGVLWGIYRLSKKRPELVKKALHLTHPYYTSEDAVNRCLALLISGATDDYQSEEKIKKLVNDKSIVELYEDGVFNQISIGRLATEVLAQFKNTNKRNH